MSNGQKKTVRDNDIANQVLINGKHERRKKLKHQFFLRSITNNPPLPRHAKSFIYGNEVALTTKGRDFADVETIVNLRTTRSWTILRERPSKTKSIQILSLSFPLKMQMNVVH